MVHMDSIGEAPTCVICGEPGVWLKPWGMYMCKECFLDIETDTLVRVSRRCSEGSTGEPE